MSPFPSPPPSPLGARIRPRGVVLLRAGVLAAALLGPTALVPPALADGTVHNVWVFNGGDTNQGRPGDSYDNLAQGYIFQQMGMLGGRGQPPSRDGDNLKQGGTTVGTVLRDANNNIIGYQSADGKSRAYNIDTSATMAQAYLACGNGGTVHVVKHGTEGGGGIVLDKGKTYDGFKPQGGTGGTGAGNGNGAYPLPPRGAGNTVSLDLNGCFTSKDPPGAPGSVTGSGAGIPGVSGTPTGHTVKVYKVGNLGVAAVGDTQDDVDAAIAAANAAIDACAKAAGCVKDDGSPDSDKYIAGIPFKDLLTRLAACVNNADVTLSVDYSKTETPPAGGDGGCVPAPGFERSGGCYYEPPRLVFPDGGTIHYEHTPPHTSIDLFIPPGALPQPTTVYLSPTILDDSVALPPGTRPATYVVNLSTYSLADPLLFAGPVQLRVSYPPATPILGFFEVLPDGTLIPVPATVGGGQIQAQVQHGGIYLALGPAPNAAGVPTVTQWGLIIMGSMLTLFGIVVIGRRG
ncbi:MAG: hypothetical protein IT438_09955 [Phycisphaerales bacterium]|nr:hypothetical protein [Phycisphaerales bacterium]